MINYSGSYQDSTIPALRELTPQMANRVFGPALAAAAMVARARARTRNFVFKDGRGVRRFDRRADRSRSVRLRSTIRVRRVRAYYDGRRYPKGRAAIYAGRRRALHGFLVHEGHGGPHPARPHPFLTTAVNQTIARQRTAFLRVADEKMNMSIRIADRRGWSRRNVQTFGRTVARRGRRR